MVHDATAAEEGILLQLGSNKFQNFILATSDHRRRIRNDVENVLGRYGDYSYEQITASMNGINSVDFTSNYRMITSVVSKGKFQRYGAIQKTDGMSTQFGYAEVYAVLRDNKLTVISGQLLSTDMTERQNFSELIRQLEEKVEY